MSYRADKQLSTDIFMYEQVHNMMQVWPGKLSELQLPVQNPARVVPCTSMSYKDRCIESGENQFHLLLHQTDRQTDGRTDRRTDGRTDGQTQAIAIPLGHTGRGVKTVLILKDAPGHG